MNFIYPLTHFFTYYYYLLLSLILIIYYYYLLKWKVKSEYFFIKFLSNYFFYFFYTNFIYPLTHFFTYYYYLLFITFLFHLVYFLFYYFIYFYFIILFYLVYVSGSYAHRQSERGASTKENQSKARGLRAHAHDPPPGGRFQHIRGHDLLRSATRCCFQRQSGSRERNGKLIKFKF